MTESTFRRATETLFDAHLSQFAANGLGSNSVSTEGLKHYNIWNNDSPLLSVSFTRGLEGTGILQYHVRYHPNQLCLYKDPRMYYRPGTRDPTKEAVRTISRQIITDIAPAVEDEQIKRLANVSWFSRDTEVERGTRPVIAEAFREVDL